MGWRDKLKKKREKKGAEPEKPRTPDDCIRSIWFMFERHPEDLANIIIELCTLNKGSIEIIAPYITQSQKCDGEREVAAARAEMNHSSYVAEINNGRNLSYYFFRVPRPEQPRGVPPVTDQYQNPLEGARTETPRGTAVFRPQ